jgi:hypothetical protein
MGTTWSETDALTADREVAAIYRAADERIENARTYAEWAVRQGRTDLVTAQAWVAEVAGRALAARDEALAALDAPSDHEIVCTEGSCLRARPGTPCDCTTCFGADHGAKSTLAPAACGGTKVLVERNPRGPGYVYPRS